MTGINFKPLDEATFNNFKDRTVRNKNTQYWIDRNFRAVNEGEKKADEFLRDMQKVYEKSLADLQKEIEAFYGRYATENGLTLAEVNKRLDPKQLKSAIEEIKRYYEFADPAKIGIDMSREYRDELRRLSARAYMSRLEEIKARLKHEMVKLAAEQEAAMTEKLKEVYEEAHAEASYNIDYERGFSEGYSAPNNDVLEKVVKEKWLEDNYSSRVWKDKGRLLTSIETELLSGIAQGHNPKKIAEAMAEKYSQNYKNCERVARTETIHTMNVATSNAYKAHGIEKYEFVCDLSERTCEKCGALDGTVHDLKYKQEGVNYPVMHPNCYDEQTEVLTKDGWKLFKDCTIDDEYFSLNPEKPSETAYLKAVKCISDKQRLIHFHNAIVDLKVTHGHKMLVKDFDKLKFNTAKELAYQRLDLEAEYTFLVDKDLNEIPLTSLDIDMNMHQAFNVYCVELPKWHTLLVRRNGSTPVWSGNCRCTTIPYFEKDEIDAMFDEDTRIAYDENHTRYEVPESMSYEDWLRLQSEILQKQVVGKSDYEDFAAGMTLKDILKRRKQA